MHPETINWRARRLQKTDFQLQKELDDLRSRAQLLHKRAVEGKVSRESLLHGLWNLGREPENIKFPEYMP